LCHLPSCSISDASPFFDISIPLKQQNINE
jgi:hypothetical protein